MSEPTTDQGPAHRFKSFLNAVSGYSDEENERLLKDCKDCFTCREVEDGDNYSVGSTFFIRAADDPACGLEALAMQIFAAHTAGQSFDHSTSGAEWWTQYIDHRDDIGFHWDRDYGLEEDEERHVHPLLGTVTYMTGSTAAPTVIFDKKGTFEFGSDASGPLNACVLSYPSVGKHICFDGELLHGSPSSLAFPAIDDSVEDFRITFLVNIWLDHIPTQSQRLDADIAKSLRLPIDLVARRPINLSERQSINCINASKSHNVNHKWAIGGTEYIIDVSFPPVRAFKGVKDAAVVDLIKLRNSSMYPGELSESSESDDSDSEEEESSSEETKEVHVTSKKRSSMSNSEELKDQGGGKAKKNRRA